MRMSDRQRLFDDWALDYDRSVRSDEAYPFAGYDRVLDRVVDLAEVRPSDCVLDIGIGTGNLSSRLSSLGCELWGVDFSAAMLAEARKKLPQMHLVQADLLAGWPSNLPERFDRIVSAYVLHEFDLETKLRLIADFVARLSKSGRIVIGDIAFDTEACQGAVRKVFWKVWDSEEHYWVADQIVPRLLERGLAVTFEPVSFCGGVFAIERRNPNTSDERVLKDRARLDARRRIP